MASHLDVNEHGIKSRYPAQNMKTQGIWAATYIFFDHQKVHNGVNEVSLAPLRWIVFEIFRHVIEW